ncbi:MAG: ribonuclease T [Gammaproteobacteria bacterium]|nr:ribonuclease T [Gammaproteobacteria bacterium]
MTMKTRFRGYLPVVVDLETGGFDSDIHALLEIAAVTLDFDDQRLVAHRQHRWAVIPHPDTAVEEASLKVTGIDIDDPAREAVTELDALRGLFRMVRGEIKRHGCQRAIVTAHNAHFDHGFIHAAAKRSGVKRSPFHPFSVIDTVALAAVHYGHTVLSEACGRAGIAFDAERAHSAAYDAQITAELFCAVVNARP